MKSKQLDQINKYSSLIHVHVLQVSDDAKIFFGHKTSKSMYAKWKKNWFNCTMSMTFEREKILICHCV